MSRPLKNKFKYGVVCKMGINDLGWGKYTAPSKLHGRIYRLWQSMLLRCYDEKTHLRRPKYIGCTVCERWHTFSNFVEDVFKIPNFELWANNNGYCLDKDIRVQDNKVYSLDTCIFVSAAQNSSESIKRNKKLSVAKTVIITFPNGEEKEFSNSTEAGKAIGISRRGVCAMIHNDYHLNDGYKARYKEVA